MCRQAHIIRRSCHHWRSQHHLPKANIIQKTHLCLGRQRCVFCWWNRRAASRKQPSVAFDEALSTKQGAHGASVPSDNGRLCDLTGEPSTPEIYATALSVVAYICSTTQSFGKRKSLTSTNPSSLSYGEGVVFRPEHRHRGMRLGIAPHSPDNWGRQLAAGTGG